MSRPEAPEISDVALFKQQMAQATSSSNAATPASKLGTGYEQTEGLIDLSQEFTRVTLFAEIPFSSISSEDKLWVFICMLALSRYRESN